MNRGKLLENLTIPRSRVKLFAKQQQPTTWTSWELAFLFRGLKIKVFKSRIGNLILVKNYQVINEVFESERERTHDEETKEPEILRVEQGIVVLENFPNLSFAFPSNHHCWLNNKACSADPGKARRNRRSGFQRRVVQCGGKPTLLSSRLSSYLLGRVISNFRFFIRHLFRIHSGISD